MWKISAEIKINFKLIQFEKILFLIFYFSTNILMPIGNTLGPDIFNCICYNVVSNFQHKKKIIKMLLLLFT